MNGALEKNYDDSSDKNLESRDGITYKDVIMSVDDGWKLKVVIPPGSNPDDIEERICTEKVCLKSKPRKRKNRKYIIS